MDQPPFLREGMMLAAALGSWFATSKSVHDSNHFNFHPIREVAILFAGIFATMMPALDWLQTHASGLGEATPGLFYWGAGSLSSILDNAPTYLCFLKAGFGRFVDPDVVRQVHALIQSHGAGLAGLVGAQSEEIKQTFLALQKYHAAGLVAGTVSRDEIEVAFMLGNVKLNSYIPRSASAPSSSAPRPIETAQPQFHGEGHRRAPESSYARFPRLCYEIHPALPVAGAGGRLVSVLPAVRGPFEQPGSRTPSRSRCAPPGSVAACESAQFARRPCL